MENGSQDHRLVPSRHKTPRKRHSEPKEPLFIGQWIRALGFKPADVAEGTKINEGYISQLISGEKDNPSGGILLRIANFLDIPMGYLYRPPPGAGFVAEGANLRPDVLVRLRPAGKK